MTTTTEMTFHQKWQRLQRLYGETLAKHGLPFIPFKLDRAVKRLGAFVYYNPTFLEPARASHISISKNYLEKCPIEMMEDVVLHEIAHYLDFTRRGKTDHSNYWKRCAIEVGANPTRTEAVPKEYQPKRKYTLTCPTCGKESTIQRRPKRRKSCGKCSPVFDERHELILTQNW